MCVIKYPVFCIGSVVSVFVAVWLHLRVPTSAMHVFKRSYVYSLNSGPCL
jgi:hypothetical protein